MEPRHDWTTDQAEELLARPFHELLFDAHSVHREVHDPQAVEAAMLLSVKTGACPEDCAYCPQSAHHDTGLDPERLMATDEIVAAARNARPPAPRASAWARPGGRRTTGRWPRWPTPSGPSARSAWRRA